MDGILRVVHNIFAHIAKRVASWVKYATPLGVTAFRFPVFNTTRWFSRISCLTVLMTNLLQFINWLADKSFGTEGVC
eukprot:140291-Chlamydomonas_euryale.AAC.1